MTSPKEDSRLLSEEQRAEGVFYQVRRLLTASHIDLTSPRTIKEDWQGNSGAAYSVSVTVGDSDSLSGTFSSGRNVWFFQSGSRILDSLQFIEFGEEGSRDRKGVVSYGGYNVGEAQRDLNRNPNAKSVDVFDRFDSLVSDLSTQ